MKKIMFNDKFALTQAVLDGRKTMTRRVVNFDRVRTIIPGRTAECCLSFSPYKVGDVVAVAQSYFDAGYDPHMLQFIDIKEPTILPFSDGLPVLGYVEAPMMYHAGWKNKMFVHPTMMPHHIRITNVRVERLQDISDEDCMKEGIRRWKDVQDCPELTKDSPINLYEVAGSWDGFLSPREAFAALIDKVCGKGTWKSNPWVYVYGFELIPNLPMDCRLCSVHPAGSSKCGHRVDYPGGTFGCDRYGKLLG